MEVLVAQVVKVPELEQVAALMDRLDKFELSIRPLRDSAARPFKVASDAVMSVVVDLEEIRDVLAYSSLKPGPRRTSRARTSKGRTIFLEDPRPIVKSILSEAEAVANRCPTPTNREEMNAVASAFKELVAKIRPAMRQFHEAQVEAP